MRQTTRRKYYGRNQVASALRVVVQDLQKAIQDSQKPSETPLSAALDKTVKELKRITDACQIYKFGNKRFIKKVERVRDYVMELLEEAGTMPVFQEERLAARQQKAKAKAVNDTNPGKGRRR